ncbi:MAG: hypothetical protein PHS59_18340 [Paludibacter sp.]|nr:hypothetical protein [Paludibacter sp.]
MKNLKCPQCDIHRFFVKNDKEETRIVTVNEKYEVVLVHENESLDGFNLDLLFCLGCSWKGSPKSLKNGDHKKKY